VICYQKKGGDVMAETITEMKYRHENELIELDKKHEGERSLLIRHQRKQIEALNYKKTRRGRRDADT